MSITKFSYHVLCTCIRLNFSATVLTFENKEIQKFMSAILLASELRTHEAFDRYGNLCGIITLNTMIIAFAHARLIKVDIFAYFRLYLI